MIPFPPGTRQRVILEAVGPCAYAESLTMRMFRSFLLRLTLILSVTGSLCLMLMAATLGIQKDREGAIFCGLLFGVLFLWMLFNWFIIRRVDPELSVEVARILFPAGIVLSLALSVVLAMYLKELIAKEEGYEHWILPFVGMGVSFYLIVRCFDIRWLRGEEEIAMLEEQE